MKARGWRIPAFIMAAVLTAASLTGCEDAMNDVEDSLTEGAIRDTITTESKWLDSMVDGAVDADTGASEKDDFYTAVNKEWLLNTSIEAEENGYYSALATRNMELVKERKLALLKGETTGDEITPQDDKVLPTAQAQHLAQTLQRFTELVLDWDTRNSLGAEPLRTYIEAIENLSSLEEMNTYLEDEANQKFCSAEPIAYDVETPQQEGDRYIVNISEGALSLSDAGEYYDGVDLTEKEEQTRDVHYVLEQLGYSSSRADELLAACYRCETRLAKAVNSYDDLSMQEAVKKTTNSVTWSELEDMQGAYPLTAILESRGFGGQETVNVENPSYVKAVARSYRESNLEEWKAYFIIHTVQEAYALLGKDTLTYVMDFDSMKKEEDRQWKEEDLLLTCVTKYLRTPMEEAYVASYCTSGQRGELLDFLQRIKDQYCVMLQKEAWLSEETKAKAIEKLDGMVMRALYPDDMKDYSELDLESAENLVEAVARIRTFEKAHPDVLPGETIDRNHWDMTVIDTTDVNAAYNTADNSINIYAGILADGFVYSTEASEEENMARLGTVAGHEVSHGFDTTGSQFDAEGRLTNWWTAGDREQFEVLAARVEKYYNGLAMVRGIACKGSQVRDEAIADMGGLSCMMAIAKGMDSFDYEKFFVSYGELWANKATYRSVKEQNDGDVHPLEFLRVNVGVQQFDEFQKAFGITEGDGMYLSPKDRILVW